MANTRPLTETESRSLESLRKLGLDCALLFLTETGMEKSILDAVFPVRQVLKASGLHDFDKQGLGQERKVLIEARWIQSDRLQDAEVSLYRPETKQGDPRLWVMGMKTLARPGDVIAVFAARGMKGPGAVLHFIDLTLHPIDPEVAGRMLQPTSDIDHRPVAPIIPIGVRRRNSISFGVAAEPAPIGMGVAAYISSLRRGVSTVASTLLQALRGLAGAGPLPAVCKGPTAVGRTIETALGININSSRLPDYFGIELKSARSAVKGNGTRLTLFACVADWNASRWKSSAEILDAYGYDSAADRRLYCTVSSRRVNSQGLYFDLESKPGVLCERKAEDYGNPNARRMTAHDEHVAAWPFDRLEEYLHAKHKETFWVKARVVRKPSGEAFQLESVEHTVQPSSLQFFQLIQEDVVTMDHLIKRKAGKVSEKGPLFKIERDKLDRLFLGGIRQYKLT